MAKICIAIRGWAEPASDDNVLRSCRTIFSIIRKLKLSLTLLPFQVLFAISFFVAVNDTPAAEATRAKRVLMVSTGSRFSIAFPTLEQNAVDKLRELNSGNLEFYSEYLDIIRFPSEKHHRIFREYLRDKYADDVPDLIILFYAGNLRVAKEALAQLFPRLLFLPA